MVFDVFRKAVSLLLKKRNDAIKLFLSIALFLIFLISYQGFFLGHIESLVTTLGAYIQALLDAAATNEVALLGTSAVGYVLADAIVKQALFKLSIAYIGLFTSLFLIWNGGMYVLSLKFGALTHKVKAISFKKFTVKNVKWFGLFMVYTLVYLIFNLKFSLVDQVISGSSWQQSALGYVDGLVRLAFLFFILLSYTHKPLFKFPKLNQIGVFLFALVSIFVFDVILGFFTAINSLFYILGFCVLIALILYFTTVFLLLSTKEPKSHKLRKSRRVFWSHILVLLALFIIAIPFSSFFLLTGLDETGVITQTLDLQSTEQLADLLRTTQGELGLLYESGVRVIVIEFSDFDCPFCKNAQPYVDDLHERESVFVYRRHFPVTSLHPQSYSAALYYECIKAEGFAYDARNFLYGSQSDHTQLDYDQFTNGLSLSVDEITACMKSDKTKQLVEHDISTARSLGMSATPTFYVVPLDDVSAYVQIDGADEQKIESILQKWS